MASTSILSGNATSKTKHITVGLKIEDYTSRSTAEPKDELEKKEAELAQSTSANLAPYTRFTNGQDPSVDSVRQIDELVATMSLQTDEARKDASTAHARREEDLNWQIA